MARIQSDDVDLRMPPKGDGLPPESIATLEAWIQSGAPWPATAGTVQDTVLAPLVADVPFLRRVYLDTVGIPPTEAELRLFLADSDPYKRFTLVDRLLDDPRIAGNYMGEWLDMLAEKPHAGQPGPE